MHVLPPITVIATSLVCAITIAALFISQEYIPPSVIMRSVITIVLSAKVEFVLFTVLPVKFMPWKNHLITGVGKPSAEHDKFTALLVDASTLCGSVINRGVTKQ